MGLKPEHLTLNPILPNKQIQPDYKTNKPNNITRLLFAQHLQLHLLDFRLGHQL